MYIHICLYVYIFTFIVRSPTSCKKGTLPLQNIFASKLCAKKSPRLKRTPALLHCLSYFSFQSLTELMAVFGGQGWWIAKERNFNAELLNLIFGNFWRNSQLASFELKRHQSQVSLTPFVRSGHRCNKAEYAASIAFQRSRPLNTCNAHDPSIQSTICPKLFLLPHPLCWVIGAVFRCEVALNVMLCPNAKKV